MRQLLVTIFLMFGLLSMANAQSRRADYLAFVKSPTTLITSEVSDNFDVRVYKDTAVLIARDTITLQRKSVMVVEVYRYIDVWVKRAGRWQCVATESYEVKKQ